MSSVGLMDRNHLLFQQISQDLHEKQKALMELDDQMDATIKNMNELKIPKINVENEKLKTQGLSLIIEKTWKVAQELTENVLLLQTRQEEVSECLHLLQSIQDIKSMVVDLSKIIKSADKKLPLAVLENACQIVKRYVDLDCIDDIKEIYTRIGGSNSIADTYSTILADSLLSTSPVHDMEELIISLTDFIMDAFDDAIAEENAQEITAVFKLFPMIGKGELGLDKLSAYVCGLVSRNIAKGLKKAVESKNDGMYLDCLVLLFEAVANMIDRQESTVEYFYGPGSMLIVIQRLQREADVQAGILLSSLSNARQLDRKVKEIKHIFEIKMKSKSNTVVFDNDTIDSREIDTILNELSTLCNKSQLFDRFIRMRAQDEIEKIRIFNEKKTRDAVIRTSIVRKLCNADDEKISKQLMKVPDSIGIPAVTKLASAVHELINNFVLLASFYMEKSIAKAIKLDKLEEDQLISSMVDDVFFVFKSTLMRGVDTGDAGCLCGLINSVSRILEEDYMALLLSRLSAAFSGMGSITESERLAVISPLLNNIDQSCQFIDQLCEKVEADVKRVFFDSSNLEKEQIFSCLESMTEYSTKTRLILRRWIENYFSQVIKPKIRNIVAGITMESKYVLSEEEYNSYSLFYSDTLPIKLMNRYEQIIKPHQDKLTSSNLTLFAGLVLNSMLKEWEIRIMSSKVNLFGALRLDGEIRGCVARFSTAFPTQSVDNQSILSLGVIRDLFARLSQVALVLGLEKAEEIKEMWGRSAGAIKWRLNANEVRKILACRIESEFAANVINGLEL